MKADAKTEREVLDALNRLSQAYAKRDPVLLQALFTPDADVVMYGTGADEKRIGVSEVLAQANRDWSQTDSAAIDFQWTSVSAAGPVAWTASDATFRLQTGGESMEFPARVTHVFEKRGDRWLIVQSHFSLPAAAQEEGEAFPT
jgi:ketosteroid isomerase-like protein